MKTKIGVKSHPIDYKKIFNAIQFYTGLGYQYIEVPWMVSIDSIDVTRPPECLRFDTWGGSLIGSGEQAFLEIRQDLCPGRKYQCATPCFRHDVYDQLHFPQFFKVELIIPLWKNDDAEVYFKQIVDDAWKFVTHYNSSGNVVAVADTKIGKDINVAGIEVGSYGVREHEGFRWVYGTGIAEPRFTQAMESRDRQIEKELEELCRH